MKKPVNKRAPIKAKSFKAKTIHKRKRHAASAIKSRRSADIVTRMAPSIPPILFEVAPPAPPPPEVQPQPAFTVPLEEEPLLAAESVLISEPLPPVPEPPVVADLLPEEPGAVVLAPAQATPPRAAEEYMAITSPESLSGVSQAESAAPPAAVLPENYGTGTLHLLTLDPHCLYSTWDFDDRILQHHRERSADGQLHLRLYAGFAMRECVDDIRLNPEADNWFIPVRQASMEYQAELGYHNTKGAWERLAQSGPVFTPPDAPAGPSPVTFVQLSGPTAVPSEPSHASAEAVPAPVPSRRLPEPPPWTSLQEAALEEMVVGYFRKLAAPSSAALQDQAQWKITRGHPHPEVPGPLAAMPTSPSVPSMQGLPSSPVGVPSVQGAPPARPFWLNINAELVIYGATEPNARVTMGGHPIQLRPDGTFSFRFILPDGVYHLPVKAVASDGSDAREALLGFIRHTDYTGQVGAHPQDPALKPPKVEHVA